MSHWRERFMKRMREEKGVFGVESVKAEKTPCTNGAILQGRVLPSLRPLHTN